MTATHPLSGDLLEFKRVIGQFSEGRAGPLLLVLAGQHGNEPAGIVAVQRVLEKLRCGDQPLFGHFCALAGNLTALAEEVRFVDEDMNRCWTSELVDSLRGGGIPRTVEQRELAELVERIDERRRGSGQDFFLDLHTTSSASLPYISVPRDSRSVRFAGEFPLFTVLGLGDALIGSCDRYLVDQGFVGFTFEAGQHASLGAIENHEAAIWVALHRGCLPACPPRHESQLACSVVDRQRYFSVEYVHAVDPGSGYLMRPGYYNFQRICRGDLLGWERELPVLSQWDARIFMPLYQDLGNEAFTVIRELDEPHTAVHEAGFVPEDPGPTRQSAGRHHKLHPPAGRVEAEERGFGEGCP